MDPTLTHGGRTPANLAVYTTLDDRPNLHPIMPPNLSPVIRDNLRQVEGIARAIHDFQPRIVPERNLNTDMLPFHVGQNIRIVKRDASGWLKGEVDGRMGWFPSNYVTFKSKGAEDKAINHQPLNMASGLANGYLEQSNKARQHRRHSSEPSTTATKSPSSSSFRHPSENTTLPSPSSSTFSAPFPSGHSTRAQIMNAVHSNHDQCASLIDTFISQVNARPSTQQQHAFRIHLQHEIIQEVKENANKMLTILEAVLDHTEVHNNPPPGLHSSIGILAYSVHLLTLSHPRNDRDTLIGAAIQILESSADCMAALKAFFPMDPSRDTTGIYVPAIKDFFAVLPTQPGKASRPNFGGFNLDRLSMVSEYTSEAGIASVPSSNFSESLTTETSVMGELETTKNQEDLGVRKKACEGDGETYYNSIAADLAARSSIRTQSSTSSGTACTDYGSTYIARRLTVSTMNSRRATRDEG